MKLMPNQWIQKLNESNSRLHKEDAVKQALEAALLGAKDADHFLNLAYQAYNSYITFNIKKVPTTENVTGQTNDIDAFYAFLRKLQERELTGNAALAEVDYMSACYDSDLWNELLRPTILKDLRVGATINTFNKICKGTKYEIPVFTCQLATDSAKHPKKLIGKKILEPKLDGIRACAVVDMSFPERTKVTLHTRNGKVLANFPHIEEQIVKALKLHKLPPNWNTFTKFVFDGEIVSENFQALMKQAQRKTDVDTSAAVYSIFDIIPLDKFNEGIWPARQEVRTDFLSTAIERFGEFSALHIIEGFVVDLDTAEGKQRMQEYGEEMVADGYEGIMIKDPDAPYICKRKTAWMKWKPTITVDLTLIDMEEGTGRNEGRLGALVCEGVDDGRLIQVNVGSGLSDADRDDFWARRDELKGFVVEVKADVVTQNEDGGYSLRFPRFEGFRGFEAGEKI